MVSLILPFAWTVFAILIESRFRGSMIYSQTRVGENGQTFTLYKFRSMIMGAEKGTGPCWANKDDSRITRVGKFIRKTRLDELPQLYNVLTVEVVLWGRGSR